MNWCPQTWLEAKDINGSSILRLKESREPHEYHMRSSSHFLRFWFKFINNKMGKTWIFLVIGYDKDICIVQCVVFIYPKVIRLLSSFMPLTENWLLHLLLVHSFHTAEIHACASQTKLQALHCFWTSYIDIPSKIINCNNLNYCQVDILIILFFRWFSTDFIERNGGCIK